MRATLPLAAPSLGPEEERAVAEVVRSGWLTMGPRTAALEEAFAAMAGTRHAVMVSSCTAALHLAYVALGLGPGDEVIVPSLTFVATANAVAYTGATPRFADVTSLDEPVIDPEAVRALIGPRTRAICAVHYAGYLADMDALGDLARRHGLALVEDAAHAPGAGAEGRRAGSLGDLGCFSFFSNKNIVTGEGGMVTTDDELVASRLRRLRAHGMTATSWDRERGHATGYDVPERGFNYRPSEIEAALGLVQLGRFPALTHRRRELVRLYRALVGAPGPSGLIPFAGRDAESACHILPFLASSLDAREHTRRSAAAASVQTSVHYPPVHRFAAFGDTPEHLPVTDEFARREVTLPLFPAMSDTDVERVAALLPVARAA